MSKKSRSSGKIVPPAVSSTGREVTITPLQIGLLLVFLLLLCGGLYGLFRTFEAPAEQVATQSGDALILPPGSLPQGNVIQVQPSGDGMVQVPSQSPQGQVVMPSGANRLDSTPEGFPMEGGGNAPVTIVEFSDFQCPYCRQFAQELLPQIREKYLKGGKVRFVWRDMAIRGPESEAAAAAALCAHEQGRFWPYHDALYTRQQGQNQGVFTPDTLKAVAAEVGRIEPQLFATCLDSNRYLPAVRASTQEATAGLKLTGTPTFFVNGNKIEGNLEWAKWDEMLSLATQ